MCMFLVIIIRSIVHCVFHPITLPRIASEMVSSDDVHEKAVNLVTVVYQLEGEGDKLHYTPIHENSTHMVKVSLLNTKKVS